MSEVAKINTSKLAGFQALKDASDQLAIECAEIKVNDDTTEAIAEQILSKAKMFENNIEAKRKELKAPSIKEGKDIDSAAKLILEGLRDSVKNAKSEVLAYKEKAEAIRKAELHRIESLGRKLTAYKEETMALIDAAKVPADLKDVFMSKIKPFPGAEEWQEAYEDSLNVLIQLKAYGTAKKQALLNPEKAQEIAETQNQIKEQANQATENVAEVAIIENETEKKSGLRTTWKFEVSDMNEVPKAFLMLDDKKVKEFMKEAREKGDIEGETIMHGIRFYPEKILVTK